MDVFGWILFAVGALLLVLFAFIGIEAGGTAVVNLAGILVGSAMMISGAVFVAGSRIEQALKGDEEQAASEIPQDKTEEEKEQEEEEDQTATIVFVSMGLIVIGALIVSIFFYV